MYPLLGIKPIRSSVSFYWVVGAGSLPAQSSVDLVEVRVCTICSISLSCKCSKVSFRGDQFCIFLARRLRFGFIWLLCMGLPTLFPIFLLLVSLFHRILFEGLGRQWKRGGFLRWSRSNVPRLVGSFVHILPLFLVVLRSCLVDRSVVLRWARCPLDIFCIVGLGPRSRLVLRPRFRKILRMGLLRLLCEELSGRPRGLRTVLHPTSLSWGQVFS